MGRNRFLGALAQGAFDLANNTILDGETFSIGGKVYEFDDDASVSGTNVLVTIGGTAALTAAEMVSKINANKPTPGVTAAVDSKRDTTVRLKADSRGAAGNLALAETVADAGFTKSGSTMVGGENGGTQTEHRGQYTVTDIDVLADQIVIETGLGTPRFPDVSVRSSAGVPKAHTAEISIVGTTIKLNFAGATDPAAGDVVTWEAWE